MLRLISLDNRLQKVIVKICGLIILVITLTGCILFRDVVERASELCAHEELTITTNEVGEADNSLCNYEDGTCDSLRAAVRTAWFCRGDDVPKTIHLVPDAEYVIRRSEIPGFGSEARRLISRSGQNGLAHVGSTLFIEGNGATISRNSGDAFRFFHVLENGSLTMRNITLKGGGGRVHESRRLFISRGGAIYNEGKLTLSGVSFIENQPMVPNGIMETSQGGAIYNRGELMIIGSTIFRENLAVDGSAIYNHSSSVNNLIEGALFESHSGKHTIFNIINSEINITRSTFSNNNTESVILSRGNLLVESTTFNGNQGNSASVTAFGGNLIIRRSTFSGERGITPNGVGAIQCDNIEAELQDLTIYNARSDGIRSALLVYENCSVTLINNVFHGEENLCTYANQDNLIVIGTNFSTDNSCPGFMVIDDPRLGDLQDNGGPTLTHMPLPNSPLIDSGEACLPEDQRGFTRPVGNTCDVGAVEVDNSSH